MGSRRRLPSGLLLPRGRRKRNGGRRHSSYNQGLEPPRSRGAAVTLPARSPALVVEEAFPRITYQFPPISNLLASSTRPISARLHCVTHPMWPRKQIATTITVPMAHVGHPVNNL